MKKKSSSKSHRTERDSMGEMRVPADMLYGASTQRAVLNFPISGRRLPEAFIRALARIKFAAAKANQKLGLLRPRQARAMLRASQAVYEGKYNSQFIPLEKIIIGLPTYGYDWSNNRGTPLQFAEIQTKLTNLKTTPTRDRTSSEMVLNYEQNGIGHTLWFEDSYSAKIKIDLALRTGINKFSFWYLGGEDPLLWE